MSEVILTLRLWITAAKVFVDVPFRPFESARGNLCFGVLDTKSDGTRYLSPYGVGVPILGDNLPVAAGIVGPKGEVLAKVALTKGETGKGRPKVSGDAAVTLLGEARQFSVSISDQGERWNLSAKAIPSGGGGKVHSLDSL